MDPTWPKTDEADQLLSAYLRSEANNQEVQQHLPQTFSKKKLSKFLLIFNVFYR